jgi:hypothetical protein
MPPGGPPNVGDGGMPHRIMVSSRSGPALRTTGLGSRNMRRSVRMMPIRRPEKVVNKVADDESNLRLKAWPVGLGAFITRPWGGF